LPAVSNKKHIVYLGCSGFPYGLAEIQKMTLISKSLINKGNDVTIICKRSVHRKANHPNLQARGNYEGINYIYTVGSPFRDDNFFKRNFLKVTGAINEIKLLKRMKNDHKIDYAILSSHSFYAILYYYFLSRIFGFKTVLNYVEYYSGVKKGLFEVGKWVNDQLYDKFAPKLVDAVFPISEFLINDLKKNAPKKKYFKIPVLTDFDRYHDTEILHDKNYFLFCGAANYIEIVKFIIDSFEQLSTTNAFLYLVINGSDNHIQDIREYINKAIHKDRILLFSRLTEIQLNTYYKNAMALLIPLRPTLQDKARFPHKIGEYLASGNPVVSTNYGEVSYYFKDEQNMLIAESYDIKLFAAKMQFVLEHTSEAQKIGANGKDLALNQFEYKQYGDRIIDFLNQLNLNGKNH